MLTGQWSVNYFHWMLDYLPKLVLLPDRGKLIVSAALPAALYETLLAAGISTDQVEPFDGGHLIVDELHIASFPGRTGNPPPWALQWLQETFAPSSGDRRRRIYVSRSDAPARRVVNEDEVIAALEPEGFEVVVPGELAFVDQMRVFSEAAVVVGPHGAGLTNMFASRDAQILELFDKRYVNPCFYAIADALGHEYWWLAGNSAGTTDLDVDVEALKGAVAALSPV
jgi:capsular polysaccharide biosynthesis protein